MINEYFANEKPINGINDFLDCICFLGIVISFIVVGLVLVGHFIRKFLPAGAKDLDDAKVKIKSSRGIWELYKLFIWVMAQPAHYLTRMFFYARDKKWLSREETPKHIPYVFSSFACLALSMVFAGSSAAFYDYNEKRVRKGGSAQKKYENYLEQSIKKTNRAMNFNQDILDKYNNRHDRNETHPVWHMRNFPDMTEEDGRVLYNLAWEEDGWNMYGSMGPRLEWANQLRTRANAVWREKNWQSDTYKDNLRKQGIKVGSLDEPSW